MSAPIPAPAFVRGQVLAGKYRVEKILGEGGHGIVVSAHHIALGQRVAVKVLRPEMAKEDEIVQRFLREGRAAVRMKGEHVARVIDVGSVESGEPYMVMEHLDGNDLALIVDTRGPLATSLAVDYILQACEGLAEAHGMGIVHRDIKPSNLFLTQRADGSPCIKVLDFGISKSMAQADAMTARLTQTQSIIGSPQYMAPEQMRSARTVDQRVDIWAIGATFYELLTGKPPFNAKTMAEIFAMILQDTPRLLSSVRPDVPLGLAQVVARCMEKAPENRFADINELAQALAPFSSGGAQAADRIERVNFRASQSSERRAAIALPSGHASPQTVKIAPHVAQRSGGAAPAIAIVLTLFVAAAGVAGLLYLRRARPPLAVPSASATLGAATLDGPAAEPGPPPSATVAPSALAPAASDPAPAPSVTTPRRPHLKPKDSAPAPAPKPTGVASSRYD